MNSPADPESGTPPQTASRRTVWPNVVWLIPILAMLIVGYLGVKAVLNRGEVVTVTFSKAAGAKPGETQVLYQGIQAGRLLKIVPNADGRTFNCAWCPRRRMD